MKDRLTVADIVGVYGVKGWVKLRVFLDDPGTLAQLQDLRLVQGREKGPRTVLVESVRRQGKGVVAKLKDIEDRSAAESLRGNSITVAHDQIPEPGAGEYYWHQLQGLMVWCREAGSEGVCLGRVDHLLETGANDVMVVVATDSSIDGEERLIPLLFDDVIESIDLSRGEIWVDWFVDA